MGHGLLFLARAHLPAWRSAPIGSPPGQAQALSVVSSTLTDYVRSGYSPNSLPGTIQLILIDSYHLLASSRISQSSTRRIQSTSPDLGQHLHHFN